MNTFDIIITGLLLFGFVRGLFKGFFLEVASFIALIAGIYGAIHFSYFIKDLLLPETSDADKIGYTPEQIAWCEENQEYMWRYFVEGNLLYDSDSKLGNRFINRAPFSKFYLEIDNESPGRIGTWVGWQIVRSFIKNNDVSVEQFLQMDAVEIFNKSKYKPKK